MEESACSKCGKRWNLYVPRMTRHVCELCQRLSETFRNRTTETSQCCHYTQNNSQSPNNERPQLLPDLVLSCKPSRKKSSSLTPKECGRLLKCMAENFEIHRTMQQNKMVEEPKCTTFSKAAMVKFITCFSCLFLKLKNIFSTR